MRLYETAFILNPQTDDATIDRHIKSVVSLITENGGRIILEDHIGTRRMAYAINGLTNGFYASMIFEVGTKLLPILERHYKLEEAFVRHMTVVYDGDPEKAKEEQRAMASYMDAQEREQQARHREHAERSHRRWERGGRDRGDRGDRGEGRGDRGERGEHNRSESAE